MTTFNTGAYPPGCTQDDCDRAQPGYWDDEQPPEQWFECPKCDGEGIIRRTYTVYEQGCGFPHEDIEELPCDECNGAGGFIDEAEATS